MSGFNLSKYRDMFAEEASEQFETIENLLLEAENNGTLTDDEMNTLFRAMHTLKGGSASVELKLFAGFTHEVESFLDKLRNNEIKYDPEMVVVLIDCTDVLKEILTKELSDDIESEEVKEMTVSLLEQLSIFASEFSVNNVNVEVSQDNTQIIPSQQKKDEDAFGFFDEIEIEEDEHSNKLSHQQTETVENIEEDAFGFFDDETENNSFGFFKPDDKKNIVDEDAFGFFDDDNNIDSVMKEVEDAFGFFAEYEIKTDSNDDEAFGIYESGMNVDVDIDNDAFGFFDDLLVEKHKHLKIEEQQNVKPEIETHTKKEHQNHTKVEEKKPEIKKSEEKKEEVKKPTKDFNVNNSIRVDLSKMDHLMNNIGELVIANSMLSQYTETVTDAKIRSEILERLDLFTRHIRELQDAVMSVRMVPMESIYSKFPKVVRDTSRKLNKQVEFKHLGDTVEIDKAMIEGLTDPLMHIVRDSLDHGIETPETRVNSGKPISGTIVMSAEQSNGQIIITIKDDGAGIDVDRVSKKAFEKGLIDTHQLQTMTNDEKAMLIFAPGLSTAEKITDISGRGVGMDVVMSNIKKLGGSIAIDTEKGMGTTLTIALPLTLAILDGLNVVVGKNEYILPLAAIIESLQPKSDMIKQVGDRSSELLMLRNEFIPIIRLHTIFRVEPKSEKLEEGILIVVRIGNQKVALFVDEFLNQQQFVVKPLDKNFRDARGISGATVRGDGTIGLIIDVMSLLDKKEIHDKDKML